MTADIFNLLVHRFGEDTILSFKDACHDPYLVVSANDIQIICMYLRYNPEMEFSFFLNLSGIDYPDKEKITLVYHLFSERLNRICVIKTSVFRQFPEISSIESIWKTAGWFEREIFDLLGVNFINHSNLTRILLPEDWKGHPLRKDYKQEAAYHGMETFRDNPLDIKR